MHLARCIFRVRHFAVGSKLGAADMELYRTVDEVLHYIWDPCGVSEEPLARDEYHSYLPQVFAMVRDGKDAQTIASHLDRIAVEQMGSAPNAAHCDKVASVLIAWRKALRERNA